MLLFIMNTWVFFVSVYKNFSSFQFHFKFHFTFIYTPLTCYGSSFYLWRLTEKVKNNIFSLMIELCICSSFCSSELEQFFRQMRIKNTEWCTFFSEENSTCLLGIKMPGSLLQYFYDEYCNLAINCWFMVLE